MSGTFGCSETNGINPMPPPYQRPYELRATEIAQFVRHHSCERRLRLAYDDRDAAERLPFAERLFNALDPVLQLKGDLLEDRWADTLQDEGLTELVAPEQRQIERYISQDVDEGTQQDDHDSQISFGEFRAVAREIEGGSNTFAREVEIEGQIGVFDVTGRVDFAIVRWDDGDPQLRVVETKSSRKDKTNHRIQVATYKLILDQLLEEQPLFLRGGVIRPDDVEYVVGRIDESTNQIEDILELDPLPLKSETSDVEKLLEPDGKFEAIITTGVDNIDDLDYRLNAKCDQCVFDVHCYPETARRRGLELLGLPPATIRAMQNAGDEGVRTIDDLATLDLNSPLAEDLRRDNQVQEDLGDLRARAQARRQTLPGAEHQDGEFPVQSLETNIQSQLPAHQMGDDRRVIRVYLNVDYDYSEDRVVALSAHVTNSDWVLNTPLDWVETEDGVNRVVDSEVVEIPHPDERGDDDDREREVVGEPVLNFQPYEWFGEYDADTAAERVLVSRFLNDLIDEIAGFAEHEREYIHFYVWSHSEMEHLIDACSRGGTELLSHLRELMGCREPLEQLIYSSLREEVDGRYALGWTGRGISVATSLPWYSDRFHWTRDVNGEDIDLDRSFEQDVFDFKTTLGINDNNVWAGSREDADNVPTFEIRSRYFDSLPVPYMHVVWDSLPEPGEFQNNRISRQLDRYHRANRRQLKEYLKTRTQALRWIDEKIRYYNDDIRKEPLNIDDLENFELDVDNAARAAVDFLLLDHHVKTAKWFAEGMKPPAHRVPRGKALPLRDAQWIRHGGGNVYLHADLDFGPYDIGIDEYRLRTSFGPGSFVRVCPSRGPDQGPTPNQLVDGGNTFSVVDVDWGDEEILLDPVYSNAGRYSLGSRGAGDPGEEYYFGPELILQDSITDFTAPRVHRRLMSGQGVHAIRWLDPEAPRLPDVGRVEEDLVARYEQLLELIEIGDGGGLRDSQTEAILDGLSTRVQLIHGPPGTGKTTTTAISVLLRILNHIEDGDTVVLAGNTHRAINNLLTEIDNQMERFYDAAEALGFDMPQVNPVKVATRPDRNDPPSGDVPQIGVTGVARDELNPRRQNGVLVMGGTVSAVLRCFRYLDGTTMFGGEDGEFLAQELIVDEASMMVFPPFLALATTIDTDGRILLAGDHRQLSPIVAHEWEEEDRPPVELYQPFSSAFEAVQNLSEDEDIGPEGIRLSMLDYTFRLPPTIRVLISQLYESYDDFPLRGEGTDEIELPLEGDPFEAIWEQDTGLFLVTHTERESRLSNPYEAALIERVLTAERAADLPDDSVAIMTPHTAQRSHLQEVLQGQMDGPLQLVDTVERMQGGECENIIVSATASDPTGISEHEEFLLDLNRANVAFSRTQERLVVICSEELLNHIPPEVEEYDASMLWKSLRSICSLQLAELEFQGERVRVFAPDRDSQEIRELLAE